MTQIASVDTSDLLQIIEQASRMTGGKKSIQIPGPGDLLHFRVSGNEIEITALKDGRGIRVSCVATTGDPFEFALAPDVALTHFRIRKEGQTLLRLDKTVLTATQSPPGGRGASAMKINIEPYYGAIGENLALPEEGGFLLPVGRLREFMEVARACLKPKAANEQVATMDVTRQIQFSLEGDFLWITGTSGYIGTTFKIPVSTEGGTEGDSSIWIPGNVVSDLLGAMNKDCMADDDPVRLVFVKGDRQSKLGIIRGSVSYVLFSSPVTNARIDMRAIFAAQSSPDPTTVEVNRKDLLSAVNAFISTTNADNGEVSICLRGAKENTLNFEERGGGSSLSMELDLIVHQGKDIPVNWFVIQPKLTAALLNRAFLGERLTFIFTKADRGVEIQREDQNLDSEFYFLMLSKGLYYETILGCPSRGQIKDA